MERSASNPAVTDRLSQSPLRLLAHALGPRKVWPGKAQRLGEFLRGYVKGDLLDERLQRLKSCGVIEEIPTRVQLAVGAIDMLRFFISPAAADYYTQRGISYGFHQLLRFLDEPASLGDPIGLFSTRDAIIGHLMQVVHANPLYDFQLLQMFEDGMEELEKQLLLMLSGQHPRSRSIGAIVEEPDYHARLLTHMRDFRKNVRGPDLLRENVAAQPELLRRERVFGSMTNAMRYFTRLPVTKKEALRHVLFVREFPFSLAAH